MKIAAIISILVCLLGGFTLWLGSTFNWPGNQEGYEPRQPIAFSHKVHAGDNRISCAYCHSSAEKSPVAGIPAASTCMNCHTKILSQSPEVRKIVEAIDSNRPIEWIKVHDLPDHATFNHSRHVVAGITCQQCHGAVETMEQVRQVSPMLMGDCVACHRQYREVVLDSIGRPRITSEVTRQKLMASTDCTVCHH